MDHSQLSTFKTAQQRANRNLLICRIEVYHWSTVLQRDPI